MKQDAFLLASDNAGGLPLTGWARLARALLFKRLAGLRAGTLSIEDADGTQRFGADHSTANWQCTIQVQHPRFYRRVVSGGSLGLAAAWLDGDFTCTNLIALFRMALRGLQADAVESAGLVRRGLARVGHWLRRNTRRGSRRNIRAHYDLGNDLFKLFLDETLTYSSAIFALPQATLEQAQTEKLDRICRKLGLGPDDHVLEIGTGWGSFALHAAQHYGCQVTTTTLSPAQYEIAQQRVRAAGLEERITLLQTDYRDLHGQYDKLVAIEMIEAVGADNLATFFACCAQRLKADGRMLIQVITTGEHYYADYRRAVDFIQQYVFPGSHCPSLGALLHASGPVMRLTALEDITAHYVTTLQHWRTRFMARLPAVRALGYPERFIRLWDYYLQYCEAGFAERHIGDMQLLFAMPAYRAPPVQALHDQERPA